MRVPVEDLQLSQVHRVRHPGQFLLKCSHRRLLLRARWRIHVYLWHMLHVAAFGPVHFYYLTCFWKFPLWAERMDFESSDWNLGKGIAKDGGGGGKGQPAFFFALSILIFVNYFLHFSPFYFQFLPFSSSIFLGPLFPFYTFSLFFFWPLSHEFFHYSLPLFLIHFCPFSTFFL